MAYSTLPTWPLILFGVIEPALLVWAYFLGMSNPFQYYASQAPYPAARAADFAGPAESVTLQLVNVLLLLAGLAVVCSFSRDPATARWYLVAVAFADVGHVYAAARGVGWEHFTTPAAWNDLMWGNVGASAFLNVNRWLTVLGAFGPLRAAGAAEGAGKAVTKKTQ